MEWLNIEWETIKLLQQQNYQPVQAAVFKHLAAIPRYVTSQHSGAGLGKFLRNYFSSEWRQLYIMQKIYVRIFQKGLIKTWIKTIPSGYHTRLDDAVLL